jgi:hypothetical protein
MQSKDFVKRLPFIILVVIILIAIGFVAFLGFQFRLASMTQDNFRNHRNDLRRIDVEMVADALEAYIREISYYEFYTKYGDELSDCNESKEVLDLANYSFVKELVPKYMIRVPKDPSLEDSSELTGYTFCPFTIAAPYSEDVQNIAISVRVN